MVQKTLTLLLLLGLCAPVAGASDGPRRLAVVVGANVGAPHQVRLRHAARDAAKVAQVLVELGGVRETDLQLLNKTPSAVDVLSALRRAEAVARQARDAGQETSLFFYYSGHATPKALQIYETELPVKELRDGLRKSKATMRLAVLDACHSGVVIREKGGNRTKKGVRFKVDEALGAEGYAILSSSAADEDSQESDEIRGSFFTHHLVSGLRGAADGDEDGNVTLGEAYRYAYARTLRQTAQKARVAQHPSVDMAFKGAPDVVLTSLPNGAARVTLKGATADTHWVVYEPDSGLVVAELEERPGSSVTVAVPPGKLEVYRRSSDRVSRGELVAAAGREVMLDEDSVGLEDVSLTAYLRKGDSYGLVLSALIGVQTFGEGSVRAQFVGPMPLFSLGIKYENVFKINEVSGLDLPFDVGFMVLGQQQSDPKGAFRQRMSQFQAGAGLMYRYDLDNISLSIGPRVAYMMLHREPEGADAQTMHTVAVGGALGAYWRFSESISVGVTGRVSYVPLELKNSGIASDQWVVEAQAAGAFHF